MGRVYVNFMPEDESDQVETAYGANYRRLAEIKRRYDPNNLFRMNQNIRPINTRRGPCESLSGNIMWDCIVFAA